MIWRVITHLRMRWHETMANISARSAEVSMDTAARHLATADRLAEALRGG